MSRAAHAASAALASPLRTRIPKCSPARNSRVQRLLLAVTRPRAESRAPAQSALRFLIGPTEGAGKPLGSKRAFPCALSSFDEMSHLALLPSL
jgi:hypothetical protein